MLLARDTPQEVVAKDTPQEAGSQRYSPRITSKTTAGFRALNEMVTVKHMAETLTTEPIQNNSFIPASSKKPPENHVGGRQKRNQRWKAPKAKALCSWSYHRHGWREEYLQKCWQGNANNYTQRMIPLVSNEEYCPRYNCLTLNMKVLPILIWTYNVKSWSIINTDCPQ